MTETEKRLAAVELALVDLAAWMEPAHVRAAMRSINAGLNAKVSEELLKAGLQRFDHAAGGMVVGRAQ